jgi:ribonuclease P protein component
MGSDFTFQKLEKLSHKATIDAIFQKKGVSIFKPPILFVFLKTELLTPFPCQVLFSVGKRKFKRAVHRNAIKRQLREVYRLNKQRIYNVIPVEDKYAIGILYLNNTQVTYDVIDKQLTLAIDEFIKRLS